MIFKYAFRNAPNVWLRVEASSQEEAKEIVYKQHPGERLRLPRLLSLGDLKPGERFIFLTERVPRIVTQASRAEIHFRTDKEHSSGLPYCVKHTQRKFKAFVRTL